MRRFGPFCIAQAPQPLLHRMLRKAGVPHAAGIPRCEACGRLFIALARQQNLCETCRQRPAEVPA